MKRLLILLLCAAQPVWAGWVELGTASEGASSFTNYWDPSTVRKTANGRRAWTMISYEEPQRFSNVTYRSSKELWEYDCAGERSRGLQVVKHTDLMGYGQTVYTSNSPGGWSVVSPGSIGEVELKAVCRVPIK